MMEFDDPFQPVSAIAGMQQLAPAAPIRQTTAQRRGITLTPVLSVKFPSAINQNTSRPAPRARSLSMRSAYSAEVDRTSTTSSGDNPSTPPPTPAGHITRSPLRRTPIRVARSAKGSSNASMRSKRLRISTATATGSASSVHNNSSPPSKRNYTPSPPKRKRTMTMFGIGAVLGNLKVQSLGKLKAVRSMRNMAGKARAVGGGASVGGGFGIGRRRAESDAQMLLLSPSPADGEKEGSAVEDIHANQAGSSRTTNIERSDTHTGYGQSVAVYGNEQDTDVDMKHYQPLTGRSMGGMSVDCATPMSMTSRPMAVQYVTSAPANIFPSTPGRDTEFDNPPPSAAPVSSPALSAIDSPLGGDFALRQEKMAAMRREKLIKMFGEESAEVIAMKCELEQWATYR